ncbi:MAG: DnaD domain protein [Firmicutes bacterium]|nr:DnaD domain protein [Bacillota bacterium]
MPFCKFSTEHKENNSVSIEALFFERYLPDASAEFCKVYLYGLYLCQSGVSGANTIDDMGKKLNMAPHEIIKAYEYWHEIGLVQIINAEPVEVRYQPIREVTHYKKFKPGKYDAFNKQVTLVLGRDILPNESNSYYEFLETSGMQQEALLMVMKYCAMIKSDKVGFAYILAVAKAWAADGVLTAGQVEERLQEYELSDKNIKSVLKAMGSSRNAYVEERQLFLKWTRDLGFEPNTIVFVAKSVAKGGFNRLDNILLKFYEMRKTSIKEIEEYTKLHAENTTLAKEINKTIGVYYENLEQVVDTYIVKWLELGYVGATLKQIANFCFLTGVRNLAGMNEVVIKLYKQGLINQGSINKHISGIAANDDIIRRILSLAGVERGVSVYDRENYKTWSEIWHMPLEVVLYAAGLSKQKAQPMAYINKLLAAWFEAKITGLDQAKAQYDSFKFDDNVKAVKPSAPSKREITQKAIKEIEAGRLANIIAAEANFSLAMQNRKFADLEKQKRELTQKLARAEGKELTALNKQYAGFEDAQNAELINLNLTRSDLAPKFNCLECNDTGYINGKLCKCAETKISGLIKKESFSRQQLEAAIDNLPEIEL